MKFRMKKTWFCPQGLVHILVTVWNYQGLSSYAWACGKNNLKQRYRVDKEKGNKGVPLHRNSPFQPVEGTHRYRSRQYFWRGAKTGVCPGSIAVQRGGSLLELKEAANVMCCLD